MNQILTEGFGAFAGAFFAFLFLRIGEFFSKLYQRQVRHYESLVNLELQLIEIGGIVHDNLYALPNFIREIISGKIYYNNLHTLRIDKSHYSNLYDLDLLNELFSYYYQMRKLNDDITTVSVGYSELKNALIAKHIDADTYLVNTKILADSLKQIEVFLIEFQEETLELLAKVRILTKYDKPLGTKWQSFLIHPSSKKIKMDEFIEEKKKLSEEIKKRKIESRKQIENILKKHEI